MAGRSSVAGSRMMQGFSQQFLAVLRLVVFEMLLHSFLMHFFW